MSILKVNEIQDAAGKKILQNTGGILQVVSTTKKDTYSQTSTSYTEVTGLTATITPTSTSSKILVMVGVLAGYNDGGTSSRRAGFSIFRGSTNLIDPTSPGSRLGGMVEIMENVQAYGSTNIGFSFLDSPATTSATTYSVRAKNNGGSGSTLYVNRGPDDEDSSITIRGNSTITLFEISA